MEIKINEYDNNYIIIDTASIVYEISKLQIEGKIENTELIHTLNQINISRNNYEKKERKNGNLYSKIDEVAIEKESTIGKLIIKKINNPKYICLEQLTHALLKSIDNDEWDYSEKLIFLIKRLKKFNNFKFDYQWFKLTFGEDITNYIINSMSLYPSKSRSIVYLYKNDKITKVELQKKVKTRTKAK